MVYCTIEAADLGSVRMRFWAAKAFVSRGPARSMFGFFSMVLGIFTPKKKEDFSSYLITVYTSLTFSTTTFGISAFFFSFSLTSFILSTV